MDGLTSGRIVHYVTPEGAYHRPAVITHVWNEAGTVNLFVFPDGSHPLENNTPTSVSYDKDGSAFSWHWIEKA